MQLAFLKLGDIGARSLFLLIVLYSLPVEASGQFGLLMTVLAFWSFFCGFERYIDIQRRLVGKEDSVLDRIVLENLRFYSLNFLVVTPIVLIILKLWVGLENMQIALIPLVAIAEHQSTEVYRYALIVPRYRAMLWIVLARGFVLLGAAAVSRLFQENVFTLDRIILGWSAISVVFMVITTGYFIVQAENLRNGKKKPFWQGMKTHFKASRVHFSIGLLALLSLQVDRMIVGSLLSLEQTGIYFRHVFLAMAIYQMATVVSYNRILSRVYRGIQDGKIDRAKRVIRNERWKVLPVGAALAGSLYLVRFDAGSLISSVQSLVPSLLAGLIFALSLRILADYNAIVLNAFHCERYIFRSQGMFLFVSVGLNVLLTSLYGLGGTVVSVISGAAVYLLATTLYVRKRYLMQEAVI